MNGHFATTRRPAARTASRAPFASREPTPLPESAAGTSVWVKVTTLPCRRYQALATSSSISSSKRWLAVLSRTRVAMMGPGKIGAPKMRNGRGRRKPQKLARADELLDRAGRLAGQVGDLAVLIHDEGHRRLVAVEAADGGARNLAVGSAAAVFVEHVEEHRAGVDFLFLPGHHFTSGGTSDSGGPLPGPRGPSRSAFRRCASSSRRSSRSFFFCSLARLRSPRCC